MAFDSLAAFVSMEGHGPYVWACYAVFLILMVMLVVGSLRSRNAMIESCRRGYEFQADKSTVAAPTPSASFARVNVSQD